jgi:hypothetical protein
VGIDPSDLTLSVIGLRPVPESSEIPDRNAYKNLVLVLILGLLDVLGFRV